MGFLDRMFQGVRPAPTLIRSDPFSEYPNLETQLETITARHEARTALYPYPTIREAYRSPRYSAACRSWRTLPGRCRFKRFGTVS